MSKWRFIWYFDFTDESGETSRYWKRGLMACQDGLKIAGRDAVIDGSVVVKMVNNNGDTVASGYYSAPGVDSIDFSECGFSVAEPSSVMLLVSTEAGANLDQCRFIFEPYHLWLIEK